MLLPAAQMESGKTKGGKRMIVQLMAARMEKVLVFALLQFVSIHFPQKVVTKRLDGDGQNFVLPFKRRARDDNSQGLC